MTFKKDDYNHCKPNATIANLIHHRVEHGFTATCVLTNITTYTGNHFNCCHSSERLFKSVINTSKHLVNSYISEVQQHKDYKNSLAFQTTRLCVTQQITDKCCAMLCTCSSTTLYMKYYRVDCNELATLHATVPN